MRDLLAVLAEPNRRRLLELLRSGEQSVNELAAHFSVTRPAISQHLAALAAAGLVEVRRDGRFRRYRLDPSGVTALRESLEMFWTAELDELGADARQLQKEPVVTLEKEIVVPLDADQTFALITEPERLRRWQAVTARVDLRAGGAYRFTIAPGHVAAGNYLEVEPGRRVVLSFGWEDSAEVPPGSSTVTITLEPTSGGTLVRLVHDGLTTEQAASHGEGWEHYLERLSFAAAKGDAGPDEWAAAPDPLDRLNAAEASLAICQAALRDVRANDADVATPCSNFNVSQLVGHLINSLVLLGAAAGATGKDIAGESYETRVAVIAEQTIEAWRRHGLEGTVQLGPNTVPAELAASIVPVELLVHAWDVSTACGSPIRASAPLAEYVLELANGLISPESRDGDRFAAEVEIGHDREALERLVAFTGRNP